MIYNYIIKVGNKYVFKRNNLVVNEEYARRFSTRILALNYAKRHFSDIDYEIEKIETDIPDLPYQWK